MANPKGNKASLPIGRPKGSKNKTPAMLREMVIEAVDKCGGVKYLQRQAEENPTAFLALFGKLMPKNVDANVTINGSAQPIVFRVITPDDKANKD